MAIIELEGLRVRKGQTTLCALDALRIEAGQHVGVVGANGSGKSTLLRVLAGLEREFEGSCQVSVPARERVFVHQQPLLFRGTVLSNVMYGLRARGVRGAECQRQARAWLERTGIEALADARSEHLSGGERKRTALARALAVEPRLLLLDEPLADLDDEGMARVRTLLAEMAGTTVVLTSPTALPADLVSERCELFVTSRS